MSEDPTVALDRNYYGPARQSDPAEPSPPAPVVVTGAASGIGAATVARLVAAGRCVVGLDRQPARGCPTVLCDLARPETIDAAVGELPAELGGLADVAGVPGTFTTELVLRVNVLGLRHLTEALLPRLLPGSVSVPS